MGMSRREFLAATAAGAAALPRGARLFAAPGGVIQVTIDAAKASAEISPMIFGGYMEPATTNAWAEMLSDRKFAAPVVAGQPAASGGAPFRGRGEPFRPVGPDGTVTMDSVRPFVGGHSPAVRVDGSTPRGVSQSRLRVAGGKALAGHVWLAGDPGARVVVRLVWGSGPGDAQSVAMPVLGRDFRRCPFTFTPAADSTDARLEIVATGSGGFRIGAASLMPADNIEGFRAGMVRLFKDAGFRMFKWPGGNFVSAYDWRDGIGDRDRRAPRLQPMWSDAIESNDVGLHEFIALNRLVAAEPDVAIDSGFGSAREAAEQVEYCNGSVKTRMGGMRAENGHPEPFNVKYWTIGNEMYGPWQYGHMALNQYWVKHNAIVEAMRAVDPGIKVTLAGASICEKGIGAAEKKGNFFPSIWEPPIPDTLPFEFGSTTDWDYWLLKNCIGTVDCVSEHTYAYPELRFDAGAQRFVDADDPLPIKARRLANRIGGAFDCWAKYVEMIPALKAKDIKFIFDEWGTRLRTSGGNAVAGAPRSGAMLVPLSYALCFHEMFRHSDMIAASCATGGLRLLTDSTGEAVGLPAEQVVMKLYQTNFANARPITVDGDAPPQPVPGTIWVDRGPTPTGSPTSPLDLVAAWSNDRRRLLISVVNPTEEAQRFSARISGVRLGGTGRLLQIAPPNVNASNVAGKEPEVKIVESPQAGLPDPFQVPPVSVSLWEFDVA